MRPKHEISDIFNDLHDELHSGCRQTRKAISDIRKCRTAALGGHKIRCNDCSFEEISYNSCRNRHCPKCQILARLKWVDARERELLPCPYFHIVFTVPSQLRPIFLRNKRVCYDALFRAASETIASACTRLSRSAQIGAIGVLHTWSQSLLDHPHVHFIVPGGILAHQLNWVSTGRKFFCSVRVLSRIFRGKLLEIIEKLYDGGQFQLFGAIEHLAAPHLFDALMLQCASQEFVVYAKRPFAGPKQVIRYLGQYTHRIAISNHRIENVDDHSVTFRTRSRKRPDTAKLMTLTKSEFARRFLLHILPRGFVRIRHFGFLSSRSKKRKLDIIRRILAETTTNCLETAREIMKIPRIVPLENCPLCGANLEILGTIFTDALDSS